ncbi:MAG: phosphoribosylglycinamide formyltransferase, partial [Candidatus Omnitrophota bacterium]
VCRPRRGHRGLRGGIDSNGAMRLYNTLTGEAREFAPADGKIVLVVCDKSEAYALKRAQKAGIRTFILEAKGSESREAYDRQVMEELKALGIELIVLAGFMRLLSDQFVDEYYGRIMNIHPALLPSFKGTHGIKDAFEYGVKVTGVTVHFVNKQLDAGPVILQESVLVDEKDTEETLEEKIHKVEHKLYPEAVRLFSQGRLQAEGRRVKIL